MLLLISDGAKPAYGKFPISVESVMCQYTIQYKMCNGDSHTMSIKCSAHKLYNNNNNIILL